MAPFLRDRFDLSLGQMGFLISGSLAEAVGGEAPRHERQHRAEQRRGDQDPDLAEREVVLVTQRRGQHGDAEPDRRIRGLRERPGREDDPAVAPGSYSPKGFVGRVPV